MPSLATGKRACPAIVAVAFLVTTALHAATPNATPATSESSKVLSEGCADGATPAARDAALLQARQNAVRLWLELELGQAPGDEFEPLFDYLDHYVASSRLRKVDSEPDQTCVELDVYLYDWPLRADTAALLFRLRAAPPRVAFLFVEYDGALNIRTFQANTRASELFTKAFTEKGFTIIDASAAAPAYSERELLSIIGAGDAALARYGAEVGADAVVAVEITLSAAPDSTSTGGFRAKAEVFTRAVSVSDARTHDRSRADAEIECANASSGYSFALPDAVYKLRDRAIVGAILAARTGPGEQIRLTLEGVGDFVVAQRFAELLRTREGVRDPAVVGVRAGSALLTFAYAGRMAALVDFLETSAPGLPKLEAQKVAGSEMLLRALP